MERPQAHGTKEIKFPHKSSLNIINNRAIQFVKEGNISKIARENTRKPFIA